MCGPATLSISISVMVRGSAGVHAKSLQSCLTLPSYGLQPTRLLCPRDSPGTNTGVGCHALLQGIKSTLGCQGGRKKKDGRDLRGRAYHLTLKVGRERADPWCQESDQNSWRCCRSLLLWSSSTFFPWGRRGEARSDVPHRPHIPRGVNCRFSVSQLEVPRSRS